MAWSSFGSRGVLLLKSVEQSRLEKKIGIIGDYPHVSYQVTDRHVAAMVKPCFRDASHPPLMKAISEPFHREQGGDTRYISPEDSNPCLRIHLYGRFANTVLPSAITVPTTKTPTPTCQRIIVTVCFARATLRCSLVTRATWLSAKVSTTASACGLVNSLDSNR